MENRYDLLVIGAGPGGYVAAIRAAKLGKRVALAEAGFVGGTCLNRGCIPTKALLHASQLYEEIKDCGRFGLVVPEADFDAEKIHAYKEESVAKLRAGVESLLKANQVSILRGKARVERSFGTYFEVSLLTEQGTDHYEAEKVLLAAGSVPALPPVPGLELPGVVTSDALLEGERAFSGSLVIIGGGVIGVEFAVMYAGFGRKVTVLEAAERILPAMDREISQSLSMQLKKKGVTVVTGALVKKVERGACGLSCHYEAKGRAEEVQSEQVLVATGRRANTEGLLSEQIRVILNRGQIVVDGHFETETKGLYAVGDLIYGGVQLAHAASAQAVNAVSMMFGHKAPYRLEVMPSCIYTRPEIAAVGLSEAQAKEQGLTVKTGKFLMSGNGKTVISGADRGFIKVVCEAETGVLLGAQLMCERASDLIGECCEAVASGQTAEQFLSAVHPHPTFCEAVAEAVEDTEGMAVHILPKLKL